MARTKGSTKYDYDRITWLRSFGWTYQMIADRVGCSIKTVQRAVKRSMEIADERPLL